MNCKNCGAVISENEKICLTCGAEISNDEIATEENAVSEAPAASEQKGLIAVILSIASFFTTMILGTNFGICFSVMSLIVSIINVKKPESKLCGTIGICVSAGTIAYCIASIITTLFVIGMMILLYALAIIATIFMSAPM